MFVGLFFKFLRICDAWLKAGVFVSSPIFLIYIREMYRIFDVYCNEMKTIVAFVFILTFCSACRSFVQVFETSSPNTRFTEDCYVFENDTLKVSYNFWAEKGIMAFAICNKLKIPIYIDWKKSSYIDKSVKLNYWTDNEFTSSIAVSSSYFYDGPIIRPGQPFVTTVGVSSSITKKMERVTFIPPESYYYRSQFYILPIDFFALALNTNYNEVPFNLKPGKKTKVYFQSFTTENTPLVFRNFLTISLSENFAEEFYVDNQFFISEIKEMDVRHFECKKLDERISPRRFYILDEEGFIVKFSYFKKGNAFFIYIPRHGSINNRKKPVRIRIDQ